MVRACSISVVFFALTMVFSVCFENACLGLNVNPNIFISLFVRSVVLFIVIFSLVEYSAKCVVNNIVFLNGLLLSFFYCSCIY